MSSPKVLLCFASLCDLIRLSIGKIIIIMFRIMQTYPILPHHQFVVTLKDILHPFFPPNIIVLLALGDFIVCSFCFCHSFLML